MFFSTLTQNVSRTSPLFLLRSSHNAAQSQRPIPIPTAPLSIPGDTPIRIIQRPDRHPWIRELVRAVTLLTGSISRHVDELNSKGAAVTPPVRQMCPLSPDGIGAENGARVAKEEELIRITRRLWLMEQQKALSRSGREPGSRKGEQKEGEKMGEGARD